MQAKDPVTRRQALQDLALAAGFAGLALVGLFGLPPDDAYSQYAEGGVSARTWPMVAGGLLLVLTVFFAAGAARHVMAGWRDAERDRTELTVLAKRAATLVVLIGYVVVLPIAPFWLATPLFLFVMFAVYGERNWLVMAAVAVVGGLLLHGLFVTVLNLPL